MSTSPEQQPSSASFPIGMFSTIIVESVKLCLNINTKAEGLEQIVQACNANRSTCLQLWYTPGYVTMLLLDLFDYQAALATELFPHAALSCCRTLQALGALFSSPDTVQLCRDAKIPLYIVPFLAAEGGPSLAAVRIAALGALALFCSTQPSGNKRSKQQDQQLDHFEACRRDLGPTILHCIAEPSSLLEALIALSLFTQLSSGSKGITYFVQRLDTVKSAFLSLLQRIRECNSGTTNVLSRKQLESPVIDITVLPPTEIERQATAALTAQAAGVQLLTTIQTFGSHISSESRKALGHALSEPLRSTLSIADTGSLLTETIDSLLAN